MYADSALFKFMVLSATTGERPQQTPADPGCLEELGAGLGGAGKPVVQTGRHPSPPIWETAAPQGSPRSRAGILGTGVGTRETAKVRLGPIRLQPRRRGEGGPARLCPDLTGERAAPRPPAPAGPPGRCAARPGGPCEPCPPPPRHRGRTTSLPTGMVLRTFIPPENLSRRTEGDPGCGAPGRPTPPPRCFQSSQKRSPGPAAPGAADGPRPVWRHPPTIGSWGRGVPGSCRGRTGAPTGKTESHGHAWVDGHRAPGGRPGLCRSTARTPMGGEGGGGRGQLWGPRGQQAMMPSCCFASPWEVPGFCP